MEDYYFKEFFNKSPTAYSYHKVILDDYGMPSDYEYLSINKSYEDLMGLSASKIMNKRFYDVFPKGWKGESQWKDIFNGAILKQKTTHFDMNHLSIQKWIRVTIFPLIEDKIACIYDDVTKEYLMDHELEFFLAVNPDMLCVANTNWEFLRVNQKFEHVLGYSASELEGKSFVSLIHSDDTSIVLNVMKSLEKQQTIHSFVNRVLCKDGSYRYLEWKSQPNGKYIYAAARDRTDKCLKEKSLIQLTEKLQKKNEALKILAVTDELTGLYNRHYIDRTINDIMYHSDRNHEPLTMIILDLDHFKLVNDRWGHPIGDKVLKHISELTQLNLRNTDILARFGGEEFVIILQNTALQSALIIAEKLRKIMENTLIAPVGNVTSSFGVSERKIYEPFKSWYKRADKALYLAKESGRNKVVASDAQEEPVASVNIEWKRDWESGNREIDKQHQDLVIQGNRLINLSLLQANHEQMMKQLEVVLKTIIDHFNEEELILIDIGYPDSQTHAKIHQGLIEKALNLKQSYLNGELKLSAFFSFIVDDIIVGHMLDSDIDYFPYIHKIGGNVND